MNCQLYCHDCRLPFAINVTLNRSNNWEDIVTLRYNDYGCNDALFFPQDDTDTDARVTIRYIVVTHSVTVYS